MSQKKVGIITVYMLSDDEESQCGNLLLAVRKFSHIISSLVIVSALKLAHTIDIICESIVFISAVGNSVLVQQITVIQLHFQL